MNVDFHSLHTYKHKNKHRPPHMHTVHVHVHVLYVIGYTYMYVITNTTTYGTHTHTYIYKTEGKSVHKRRYSQSMKCKPDCVHFLYGRFLYALLVGPWRLFASFRKHMTRKPKFICISHPVVLCFECPKQDMHEVST